MDIYFCKIDTFPTLAFQVTSDQSHNTTKVSLQGNNIDEHKDFIHVATRKATAVMYIPTTLV